MSKSRTCSLRSFRADRVLVGAALSAFLIAACAGPSLAQGENNPNNVATETTTTVNPANGNVQTTVTTASVGIDYSVLSDPDLNYFDIRRAQAYGMTDYQIAQAAKLAHYSMMSMDRILNDIEDGRTIPDLAMRYGVPLNDLSDVSGWQDRMHNYMMAWRNTGYGALRNGPPPPAVASYSTNTGNAINLNPTTGTTSTYNSTSQFNSTTVTPVPDGSTVAPNGTTVMPNGTTTAPNGTTVEPNGTTTAPNGTTVTPNGTTVAPNGTTVAPNGDTTPGTSDNGTSGTMDNGTTSTSQ